MALRTGARGAVRRAARLAAASILLLSLGACALPRSGPYYNEVTAGAEQGLGFEVVHVTPRIAALTRLDERTRFDGAFVGQAAADIATIQPGDVMVVTVWEGIEDGLLSRQGTVATPLPQSQVDERGLLYVPYVGQVRAAGRTLSGLRRTIRARLAEQTLNPQVDVFPASSAGRMVSVQGRVAEPGLYPIEPATTRLVAMLARAGGVGEDPEVIRVRLRRGGQEGQVWLSDLYDDPANDVALRDGDIVIAERDRRLFTALGAVGGPATVPFPTRDLSVVRALGSVGGLVDSRADPTGIFVFRREPGDFATRVLDGVYATGPVEVAYVIDLTQPGGMFVARDFMLRDGDTLYVTTAPFVRWQKVLQAVSPLVGFSSSVKTLAGP